MKIVILTAIPVEYRALRNKLTNLVEYRIEDGTIFEKGEYSGSKGRHEVIIAQSGVGNSASGSITSKAIEFFKPDLIFFIGIAGGVKDLEIGDVVIANKVDSYESGKDKDGFKARSDSYRINYALLQRAIFESTTREWYSEDTGGKFSVKVGPICVGEKVLADKKSELFSFITTHYNDTLAIDMESKGFLYEVYRKNYESKAMIVRGILDLIENKENTDAKGSQEKASMNAVDCMFTLLQIYSKEIRLDEVGASSAGMVDEEYNKLDSILKIPIEDLDLSVRAFNILKAAKINSLMDLVSYKSDSLENLPRFSDKIKTELVKVLDEKELHFDMDVSHHLLPKLVQPNPRRATQLPIVKWAQYIGKQTWKNNPIIIGDDIYVGSAGNKWNQSDEKDGVYKINKLTGEILWMFPTNSDVNEVCFYDGKILAGCDDGNFFSIMAKTGKISWVTKLDSAVITKPIKLLKSFGNSVMVSTYSGFIYIVNIISGKIESKDNLKENVMGNFVSVHSRDDLFFIPTLSGKLIVIRNNGINQGIVNKFEIAYPDSWSENGFSAPQLYSQPLIKDKTLIQGFCRHTYYNYPAIVSMQLDTGKVNWFASSGHYTSDTYGNVRTNLVLYGSEIIFVSAYTNKLTGLDLDTGKVNWEVRLGQAMFQQWSSPILFQGAIYLARHDGYLYKINLKTKKREWAMFLGSHDSEFVYSKDQIMESEGKSPEWDIETGYSLVSTPIITDNELFIGSNEGYFYCITNI